MTSLATYNGNFVDFLDNELKNSNSGKQHSFNLNITDLDIDVYCKVAILPCDAGSSVHIDTETIEDFSVHTEGSRLVVRQKPQGGISINSVNGTTVIGTVGGNMSIINGQVFVNGQRIDQSNQKQASPSQIIIRCPQRVKLDASLSGEATLASKVVFTKARVSVSGCGTVGLAAEALKIKVSGQGNSYIVMRGGDLDVTLSGQGDLKIKGEWQDADVSLSGMGKVLTSGNCLGDYSGKVSGMGQIRHDGPVAGRVREKVSGMGSCRIQ